MDLKRYASVRIPYRSSPTLVTISIMADYADPYAHSWDVKSYIAKLVISDSGDSRFYERVFQTFNQVGLVRIRVKNIYHAQCMFTYAGILIERNIYTCIQMS